MNILSSHRDLKFYTKLKSYSVILLACALSAQSVYAGSTITTCEMINPNPPREFVCDTFGDGATLISQTWSLTTGGTILSQTTGFIAFRCSGGPSGGSSIGYQFIASLSDGMTDTGSSNLSCDNSSSCPDCIPIDPQ